jgi:hypothetical protein
MNRPDAHPLCPERAREIELIGREVLYHPVIDSPETDGRTYRVREVGYLDNGRTVAWLEGKAGCVDVSALDLIAQPFSISGVGHADPSAGTAPAVAHFEDDCGGKPAASWRRKPLSNKRPRVLNATPFINRAAVRNFLLQHAELTRAHKFPRVSAATLRIINEAVRQACVNQVRQLPSKGKTI